MSRTLKYLFLVGALVAMTAACAPKPGADRAWPQVLTVSVTPNEVLPGTQFTISAFVTDSTYVTGVAFTLRRQGRTAGFCAGNATLVSGTVQAGTWERVCTAPEVVNSGTYQVNTYAADPLGNIASLGDLPENERSGHFTMLGETLDEQGPVADSVTVTPSIVQRGQQMIMSAHVTDVTGTAGVGFTLRRGETTVNWCVGQATLVSGTPTDGVWERPCLIGANAILGDYAVNTATLDLLGNIKYIDSVEPGPTSGNFSIVETPPVDPPVEPPAP